MEKAQEGSAQHRLIIEEAEKRGFAVIEFYDDRNRAVAQISNGKHTEIITQGIPNAWINDEAQRICDKKQLTKDLFERLSIRAPKSALFISAEDLNPELFIDKKEFVCKPEVSTNGIGVQLGIRSVDDVRNYLLSNPQLQPDFMIEEYVPGDDLRIQVIGGKIVAACVRKPAFVIGNGTSSLIELIEEKRRFIYEQNPANIITLDQNTLDLLEEQNIGLNDVIKAGRDIQLKRIANMGQGATAIDCTDELHPEIQNWVTKIAEKLNAPYFALDLISTDPQDIEKCAALELNLRAEWMHHTFSEVRTHNLAKIVIDELFT